MFAKARLGITVLALVASMSATALPQQPAPQSPPPPPNGPGLMLINERCSSCHDTAQVFGVRKPPAEWAATVQSMIDRGADLSQDEQKTVVAYLATNFAAPAASATPPAGAPAQTPVAPAHP